MVLDQNYIDWECLNKLKFFILNYVIIKFTHKSSEKASSVSCMDFNLQRHDVSKSRTAD